MEKDFDGIEEELKALIYQASNGIQENYLKVRDIYLTHYGMSEIDPLRDEICRCITFNLNQAAITLTNNLLEKALKSLLIYFEFKKGNPEGMNNENMDSVFTKPVKDFSKEGLGTTINACASRAIITKIQKKQLKEFKLKIRDSYSHGEIGELVGDRTVPLALGTLNNPSEIKYSDKKIIALPFLQGIFQVEVSNQLAVPYFKSVDNIIRHGIYQIYGDEIPDIRIRLY